MKKFMVAMMMLAMASAAVAAPLAQTAAPVEVGELDGAAFVTIGIGDFTDDLVIDARATYGAIENLLVSLDLGYGTDAEVFGMTLAGQYALTLDIPVELAVRVAFEMGDLENASESMAITPGVVVSKSIEAVAGLALYAGLGYYLPIGDLGDVLDGGLAFAVGATYDIAAVENLSAVVELNMVDPGADGVDATDTMGLAVGASYAF